MINTPGSSQSIRVQSSLLVTSLTQQTVLVCPSLSARLGWHTLRSLLPVLCLSLACLRLLLWLAPRDLTASVAIGRGHQTR